jgi:hypothetical protein
LSVADKENSNMKNRSLFLILQLSAHPAMASWGSFVSTGSTTVNSDVSCAQVASGQAACAASGFSNTLVGNAFNGSTWTGWAKLAGGISSAPSCATTGTGHVVCAVRGASGGLTSSVFDGTNWSNFDNQSVALTSAPGCGSDDNGRVVCAANDTSSNVAVNRYNGTSWDGFLILGGRAPGEPTCANLLKTGQIVCFARGTDSSFNGNRFNGQAWSTADWLGWASWEARWGRKAVVPSSQPIKSRAVFNRTTWSGFTPLGQTTVGNPSGATLGVGKCWARWSA